MANYKPGGGNKPQPYVPAGHGEESGEYCGKVKKKAAIWNCCIKNKWGTYNALKSKLVKEVCHIKSFGEGEKIPNKGTPNSVNKKVVGGYIVSERYYDENGNPYLDIDYTCHGTPKSHIHVPHIHKWVEDEEISFKRLDGEEFI